MPRSCGTEIAQLGDGVLAGGFAQARAGCLVDWDHRDGLRGRADAGDGPAAWHLAGVLAQRGDLDELRARAEVGDEAAAARLPRMLEKQGRHKEAEQVRRFGLNPDGSIACA